jgi:signal transduction histidine kinase
MGDWVQMEAMKKRKGSSLRGLFVRYFAYLCIGTIVLMVGLFLFYSLGSYYPANFAEQRIAEQRSILATTPVIDDSMIPEFSTYAIFGLDGNQIGGNLSKEDAALAWQVVQSGSQSDLRGNSYQYIERKDEICILRYRLVTQYQSAFFREHLPNPEILCLIIFIVLFLLLTGIVASRFSRVLARRLHTLQLVTDKIQNQDLDFSMESSGVLEIDAVLASMDQMRDALKTSLEQQWKLEQTRRDQIAALAHDLKTPMTVIRGNTELLMETEQDAEQEEYSSYILESTLQVESYTQKLIALAKAEEMISPHMQRFPVSELIDQMKNQLQALSGEKRLHTIIRVDVATDIYLLADYEALQRAITNVLVNAVEYTPLEGTISLDFVQKGLLYISISDSGSGFSQEDLINATTQFYRGDNSRKSRTNHGMGLSITKSIVEQNGGFLILGNDEVLCGARVTIEFPFIR